MPTMVYSMHAVKHSTNMTSYLCTASSLLSSKALLYDINCQAVSVLTGLQRIPAWQRVASHLILPRLALPRLASPRLTSPHLTSPHACFGNADKAWVPTGTHYLDKQAHEALTPKRPPNSPQGNKCLSSAMRRHRSPGQGRAAATSPARPAWDSSPSKAARAAGSSLGASPTRAQLKKMTASWSPGRKGFVKPDLALNRENGFSQAYKHADTMTKHSSKLKKKGSPRKARPAGVSGHATLAAPNPPKTSSSGSIWEGKLAGPSSFLQPILHSCSSNMLSIAPGDHEQHDSPEPVKKKNRPSSSRGNRHAQKASGQLQSDDGTSNTETHAQNSPPKVFTLGQSPRGCYVSPLKGSCRQALSGRLALQSMSPHRASSAPAHSPPSPPHSSQLMPQCSVAYSAHSSRLSLQDSDVCSPSEATSEPESRLLDELEPEGSNLLHDLGSGEGTEPSCDFGSFKSDSVAKKGWSVSSWHVCSV